MFVASSRSVVANDLSEQVRAAFRRRSRQLVAGLDRVTLAD